jgi:tRNA-Thr(GGU) m(6)t(6)A37 methyltransferase TsaA
MESRRATMEVSAIGVVRSPFPSREGCPRQGPEQPVSSLIEIDPRWLPALEGLEPGQDVWVICWFTSRGQMPLLVHPRGDRTRPRRGLFATRSPNRPSPLSLTLVRIEAIDGGRITVRGLEMIEGTPVLDLKPYLPGVDEPQGGR